MAERQYMYRVKIEFFEYEEKQGGYQSEIRKEVIYEQIKAELSVPEVISVVNNLIIP